MIESLEGDRWGTPGGVTSVANIMLAFFLIFFGGWVDHAECYSVVVFRRFTFCSHSAELSTVKLLEYCTNSIFFFGIAKNLATSFSERNLSIFSDLFQFSL